MDYYERYTQSVEPTRGCHKGQDAFFVAAMVFVLLGYVYFFILCYDLYFFFFAIDEGITIVVVDIVVLSLKYRPR
jgi:hypothetical protein